MPVREIFCAAEMQPRALQLIDSDWSVLLPRLLNYEYKGRECGEYK